MWRPCNLVHRCLRRFGVEAKHIQLLQTCKEAGNLPHKSCRFDSFHFAISVIMLKMEKDHTHTTNTSVFPGLTFIQASGVKINAAQEQILAGTGARKRFKSQHQCRHTAFTHHNLSKLSYSWTVTSVAYRNKAWVRLRRRFSRAFSRHSGTLVRTDRPVSWQPSEL